MLVIACSDILTLNFFWLVRDEGSWLDIGTSISHYCIGAGLVVFVSALEVVSEVFVGGVRVEEEEGEVALLGRDVKSESVKDRKLAVRR